MSYSNKTVIKDLNEKFANFLFEFTELDYSGKIPIFFVTVNCNEDELKKYWEKIVDYVGVHFQTSLENEFAVWNIYLFFLLQNPISDSLKYQIENDTFSSRKIVIEDKIANDKIIEEHVLNKDLSFDNKQTIEMPFQYNNTIWNFLKSKDSKKKITEDDRGIFFHIVNSIKQQSNEN